ncbi:conserved hypothetical protein [Streptomyces sp. C]|nr:conserved hypothetical protein [Streptomyces sp. C]
MLCGADNSCLAHLGGILHRAGDPMRTLHLAEILAATEEDPMEEGPMEEDPLP